MVLSAIELLIEEIWGPRGVPKGCFRGLQRGTFSCLEGRRQIEGLGPLWAVLEGFGRFWCFFRATMGSQVPPTRATNLRLEGLF